MGAWWRCFPGRSFPTPAQVLACPDEDLRKAGLSRQKIFYLRDLAGARGEQVAQLPSLRPDVRRRDHRDLTRVKGIGRWTAEMFLMFNLGRPDVLPLDDLGLRSAARQAYGLASLPSKRELEELGERWRPFRTVASWYLWQSTRIILPDAAPAAPPTRRERT